MSDGSDATEEDFERGMRVIKPRGPDASGTVLRDGIRFGHQRLSVIGLGPEGSQPVVSEKTNDVLVFNGEIYNYRELAQLLEVPAVSDTRVLYEILVRGRFDLLARLRGMFAFVFWASSSGRLVAARDRFGIKPLFIRHRAGDVTISSSVAALDSAAEPSEVGVESVLAFLATGYFAAGSSVYEDVSKLVPGVVYTLDRSGSGWHLSSEAHFGGDWPRHDPIAALKNSVAAHLVADVEVGVLMSGGVDSTLLAALAAAERDGLRTFSLTNPSRPEIDEAAFARHNAMLLGTRHTEIPVGPEDLLGHLDRLIRFSGEPFADAAFLAMSALSERTSEHVKVVLAGEGADELFGGYRRYDVERWLDSRGVGRLAEILSRRAGYPARANHQLATGRVRVVRAASEPDPYRRHLSLMADEWSAVLAADPALAGRALMKARHRWRSLGSLSFSLDQGSERAFDTAEWLPNVYLEKSDRASMLWGLEVRVPFLDPLVAESVRGVVPRSSRKRILRHHLRTLLPQARLPRRKMGLSVDVPGLLAAGLAEDARAALWGSHSPLARLNSEGRRELQARAAISPDLSFRLGTLGAWQRLRGVR